MFTNSTNRVVIQQILLGLSYSLHQGRGTYVRKCRAKCCLMWMQNALRMCLKLLFRFTKDVAQCASCTLYKAQIVVYKALRSGGKGQPWSHKKIGTKDEMQVQ